MALQKTLRERMNKVDAHIESLKAEIQLDEKLTVHPFWTYLKIIFWHYNRMTRNRGLGPIQSDEISADFKTHALAKTTDALVDGFQLLIGDPLFPSLYETQRLCMKEAHDYFGSLLSKGVLMLSIAHAMDNKKIPKAYLDNFKLNFMYVRSLNLTIIKREVSRCSL